MAAKVTLRVVRGRLGGEEIVFEEPGEYVIGREADCDVRIPGELEHMIVSRHHCVLEVDPPSVRVRDLGSRNGTFVNGELIGRREQVEWPAEPAPVPEPEYELREGDEVRLGDVVFRVHITLSPVCEECSEEIPEGRKEAATRTPSGFRCADCSARAGTARPHEMLDELVMI